MSSSIGRLDKKVPNAAKRGIHLERPRENVVGLALIPHSGQGSFCQPHLTLSNVTS